MNDTTAGGKKPAILNKIPAAKQLDEYGCYLSMKMDLILPFDNPFTCYLGYAWQLWVLVPLPILEEAL